MKNKPWVFPAVLIRVIDGDTIEAKVDLGFNIFFNEKFRLARIDCPEPRGANKVKGLAASAYLDHLLKSHGEIQLCCFKHGKFRWVGEVILPDGRNASDMLYDAGHAVYREY